MPENQDICRHIKILGGRFEWQCILQSHPDKPDQHYMISSKKYPLQKENL